MDSGLGSDEDRRSKCNRTKEQKQRLNQQLMSGTHTPVSSTATQGVNGACFIDASSLQDDDEIQQQEQFRKLEERRQGALLFQTNIPQYSTLMQPQTEPSEDQDQNEPDTPFNSIVHVPTTEEEEINRRPPLGFYVDLGEIDVPIEPVTSMEMDRVDKKKNMFSMVIDFEAPKKEKPTRLGRVRRKSSGNGGGSSECGSDGSSSLGWLGGSVGGSEHRIGGGHESGTGSGEVLLEMVKGEGRRKNNDSGGVGKDVQEQQQEDGVSRSGADVSAKEVKFVRLSDLEQPSPSSHEDTPSHQRESHSAQPQALHRLTRSIPESSWLESPLSLMSRSSGYYRGAVAPSSVPMVGKGAPCKQVTTNRNRVGITMKNEIGERSHVDEGGGSTSLTDSTGSKTGVSQKRLGTDLLRMFLEEIDTDVVLHIGNRSIKAHRCILISRCQYFAGTLRQRSLILDPGFSYEAVHFALCHIYSGAAHVPQAISLVELASLSDLLALEGLKEVVAHELKSRHCHHFHPPCAAGCIMGVLEVLPLAASYALDGLYHRCLCWIHQHFVHVWPSRAFSRLPSDFQQRCLQQHVVHLSADTVLGTLMGAGQILEALPAPYSNYKTNGSSTSSHWVSAIRTLVNRLKEECANWIKGQFEAVLGYIPLVAGEMEKFEETLLAAIDLLTLDQACRSYGRCLSLLANSNVSATCTIKDFQQTFVAPPVLPPHICLLLKIRNRLEMLLMVRMDRLLRSVTWTKLEPALRGRIKHLFDTYKIDDNIMIGQGRVYNLPHQRISTTHASHSSSSESSSRNSSPATSQIHTSPSLRRSLLLAAKAPQQQQVQVLPQVPVVPSSPAAIRKSTLTQPTASSAAKNAKDGVQPTKQQQLAKTPGNTISKSYHHYSKHQTTTTTVIQPNAIAHTKSTGSITITNKLRGESPILAKRQIPIRKTTSTTTANQPHQQQQSNRSESSPLALRKTASGSSLSNKKWAVGGSCSVGSSTGVVSKKQSPVNNLGGVSVVVGQGCGGGGKRQSPVMARYLLPRKRDLVNDAPTNSNQPSKTISSSSPVSSPRMRTKSAETAKVQTTKPQKHPQGSVSNTHSPVKTWVLQSDHSPVKLKQQQPKQQQDFQVRRGHQQSTIKQSNQIYVVKSGLVKDGSPTTGSPGKGKGKSDRNKVIDNMGMNVEKEKEVLMNGQAQQKMWRDRELRAKDKECDDKIKRTKPGPRTTRLDRPHSRSDSPVNFDMTETIVVNSKPITRPANFDSCLSSMWDDSNPAGPVSLKALVDAVNDTASVMPGMALLTRSGTFLKDEPSVLDDTLKKSTLHKCTVLR